VFFIGQRSSSLATDFSRLFNLKKSSCLISEFFFDCIARYTKDPETKAEIKAAPISVNLQIKELVSE